MSGLLLPRSAADPHSLLLCEACLSPVHDCAYGQLLVESPRSQRSSRLGKSFGFLILSGLGEGGLLSDPAQLAGGQSEEGWVWG